MKRIAIAAIVVGIGIEVLVFFGNHGPYPLIHSILSPNYVKAQQGYRTLLETKILDEGDVGFDQIRVAYMNLTLMSPVPPFPIDTIEGVTIVRFLVGESADPEALKEKTPVFLEYSNDVLSFADVDFLLMMANGQLSPWTIYVNLALVGAGCALMFYGLRALLLTPGRENGDGLAERSYAV